LFALIGTLDDMRIVFQKMKATAPITAAHPTKYHVGSNVGHVVTP
jgi:hypothetical protein